MEHAGSMIISRNAMWMGVRIKGNPSNSGNSASPAMGICTATIYSIALRRLS